MSAHKNSKLEIALNWYSRLNEGSRFSKLRWKFLYKMGRVFSFKLWNPLKNFTANAKNAVIVASGDNDAKLVQRLLPLDFISLEYKYRALVNAVRGGRTAVINLFFSLSEIEAIVDCGMKDDASHHILYSSDGLMDFNMKPNLLIEAAVKNRIQVIQFLLKLACIRNKLHLREYGRSPALRAAEAGHLSVLEEFLSIPAVECGIIKGEFFDRRDFLIFSARQGHVDVVKRLLAYPSMVSAIDLSMLQTFLQDGTVEVLDVFLLRPEVTSLFNYSGNTREIIRDLKDCGYSACRSNIYKSDEAAVVMFERLMRFPIFRQMAADDVDAVPGSDPHTVLTKIRNNSARAASVQFDAPAVNPNAFFQDVPSKGGRQAAPAQTLTR